MKVSANELRIGNLVFLSSKQKEYEISSGHDIEEIEDGLDAEPIPLTEEWLQKTGLEKTSILYQKGKFAIKAWKVGVDIEWVIFWGDHVILYVKDYHVHQLQNLYFALTGEELTFKTDSQ